MRKWWPVVLVVAVVAWFMMRGKSAASSSGGGTVQVDKDDYDAYVNGTATPAQMKRLGWPFISEAALSFLSGEQGARVQGPITNGPENRASLELYESARQAAQTMNPSYNATIDGYTAKLAFMNAVCSKYGRPKVYGFEDQAQPHDI